VRRNEVLGTLKGQARLASCDTAFRDAAIEAGRLLRFRSGEAPCQPGDGPGGMYGMAAVPSIILSGAPNRGKRPSSGDGS
jgi:hypothetical protein